MNKLQKKLNQKVTKYNRLFFKIKYFILQIVKLIKLKYLKLLNKMEEKLLQTIANK